MPDAILSLSKLTDPAARVPVCGFFGRQKRDPMGISAKVQMRAPNNDQWSANGAIEAMKRGRIVPKTVQNWGKTVQNWGIYR